MTAQIAILNRNAIALASDSAVTTDIGEQRKIFTSANKLFRLSKTQPVAIMFYGNAQLLDVPWEALIKVYREKLGQKAFGTLKEYADDFLGFLDNGKSTLFPQSAQDRFVKSAAEGVSGYLSDQVQNVIRNLVDQKGSVTDAQCAKIVSSVVARHERLWGREDIIAAFQPDLAANILAKYRSVVDKAIGKAFKWSSLNSRQRNGLRSIVGQQLVKKLPQGINRDRTSGIVIAGFGDSEVFPSLQGFIIDGIVENRLRYWESVGTTIGIDASATVVPFAQDDMVITFLAGVNPGYQQRLDALLHEVFRHHTDQAVKLAQSCGCGQPDDVRRLRSELAKLTRKDLQKIDDELTRFKRSEFSDPIVSVVQVLPIDELAAMAESLVNLTSFQRRVSLQSETVGGAVDVAVISKGDGFVWIKRKFYFDPQLNPNFVANYYKGVSGDE